MSWIGPSMGLQQDPVVRQVKLGDLRLARLDEREGPRCPVDRHDDRTLGSADILLLGQ